MDRTWMASFWEAFTECVIETDAWFVVTNIRRRPDSTLAAVDLVGKPLLDFIAEEDKINVLSELRQLESANTPLARFQCLLTIGRYYRFTLTAQQKDGVFSGCHGVAVDVTKQTLNEKALEDTERTVTAIFESNPHMNVMFGHNFRIIDCNPSAVELMGFKTKEDFFSGFTELMLNSIPLLQADGYPSLSMADVLAITAKDGYYRDEIDLVIRGKVRIFDLEIKRIPYGDSFALLGYMTDLTDRREKENALAQRTSELEAAVGALEAAQRTVAAMFESNPQMNLLFDSNFKLVDCNPSALRFMGFAAKEEMLEHFNERIASWVPTHQSNGRVSVPLAQRLINTAKEGSEVYETELHMDNGIRIINLEFRRIPYGDSFAIVGHLMDITEARERERELVRRDKQLEEAIEEARAANQAKSAFLANMSHEIRTPMNSIMGFAELAMETGISAHVKGYLDKITDSTQWLLRIINDILDISKIESGKMELESVPFDLHSVFLRCQSVIHPIVAEKGLDLRVYAEPPIGKKLLGDPVRLYQALMNLLSNAVKFTSAGTVKLSSAIRNTDDHSATIYFEVKDNGIGMTAEQIEKIFEPFTQADSSTTRNYGGTGLGLAITKNIVELMGGKLTVESGTGVGSAFCFELTFETIAAPDSIIEDIEITVVEKPNFDGLILICEDNPMNQQVICEQLARVGLRTVVAENGKAGVETVQERLRKGQPPFDMIFMDIFMPVMDGVEAASKITALETGAPIVAMTANVMSGELDNYKKSGMYDCVGKPFTTQELWRCLLKHLAPTSVSDQDEAARAKENDELQKKLRATFLRDNQNKYAEIAEAIATEDITLAHRLAHTLKSNAGQIGMKGLQNTSGTIEALLKGNEKPTAELMVSLEAELNAVLRELTPPLDEPAEQAEREPLNIGQIFALITKLEPMLKSRNAECLGLLDDLRLIPGAEDLVRQIEKFDFKLAAQTLAALKNRM